jgi:transmembrane sensor
MIEPSELTAQQRTALAQIAQRWDGERTERTLASAHQKLRRRRRRARVLAYTGAISLLSAIGFFLWSARPGAIVLAPTTGRAAEPATAAQSAGAAAQRMQLADGSEIALLDANTRVVVKEVSPTRMALELAAGHARFDIAHRAERLFRVMSGEVTVEVLGTLFEVERDAGRTRVSVARGRVAVQWSEGRTVLSAGEAGWFPKTMPWELTSESASSPAASAKRAAPKTSPSAAQGTWREPAERGDFEHAYALLAQTKHAPLDDVEELMLAADTARLSGHPEAALPFLKRVVEHHASDSRAPLAAFTLGGVLMQQLGRPREAETAYGLARELSLKSSLAQDALARQVEAAHRAGDSERAEKLASEYLARYPNGRRVHAVRRFGGLAPE